MKAYLVLEDGTVFEGESIGAHTEVSGEIVFTTGMTGYLETLTDPSYYGQIILQTFPLIGNYGVIPADFESSGIAARGYIVRHLCDNPSNFRSESSLDTFLKQSGIPGLQGIDTRALTKMIREKGVMNGKIMFNPPEKTDITTSRSFKIKGAVAAVSLKYTVPVHSDTESNIVSRAQKHKVALMDFGAKRSMPDMLRLRGCEVHLFGHNATAEEIMRIKPHGIMLSNGPGNPADPANALIIETTRKLMRTGIPVFGICIGHQFMALANGYKTRKMKFGHRGGNQPVKDMRTGRVYITSQNHGYTVVAGSSSFVNLNDGSCEGMDYGSSFSVQFHPEAGAGPPDTMFLFDEFIKRIERHASR